MATELRRADEEDQAAPAAEAAADPTVGSAAPDAEEAGDEAKGA
jgi:hypothetical protein